MTGSPKFTFMAEMKTEIKRENLKVGQVWRAKKPQRVGLIRQYWNDRMIIYIGPAEVQYDSPAVGNGKKYPRISMERFLKWVGSDVTAQTPKGDWNEV